MAIIVKFYFFYMKLITYLIRLGKEREFFIQGQSQKNNLKVFENLKRNSIPVNNMDQDQIIYFKIF